MNISHLHKGICQLEKLWASEKQCPPAFAVCKLELGGKAIVLQTRFRRTGFSRSQQRTKRNEKKNLPQNKKTEEQVPQRGFKEALVSDNEESDDELRITGLVLRSCSLITLLSSAFFAPIIFLLLTADTSRDEAQAASLSES